MSRQNAWDPQPIRQDHDRQGSMSRLSTDHLQRVPVGPRPFQQKVNLPTTNLRVTICESCLSPFCTELQDLQNGPKTLSAVLWDQGQSPSPESTKHLENVPG